MKTKHVFFLSLSLSCLYTVYTVYTTPSPSSPSPRTTSHVAQDASKGKATPAPVRTVRVASTPVQTQGQGKASKSKATPTLPPALPHKDTLAGRMERANKIKLNNPPAPDLVRSVTVSSTLPLTTTVQRTPTPTPYVDKGSVTGSRRVLPLFSVGKNGKVRYNGKDVIKPHNTKVK